LLEDEEIRIWRLEKTCLEENKERE
jgi:hypothetical protein